MLPISSSQAPQTTQLTPTGRFLRNTSLTLGGASSATFLALATLAALATPGANVVTSATLLSLVTPLSATGGATAVAAAAAALSAKVFGLITIYSPVEKEPVDNSRIKAIRQELSTVASTLLNKYSLGRAPAKPIPLEDLRSNLHTLRSAHTTYKGTKTIWEQVYKDFSRQGAIILNGEIFIFNNRLGERRVDAILNLFKLVCGGDATLASNLSLFCSQGFMEPILEACRQENVFVGGQACSPNIFMVTIEDQTIQVRHALALSVSHLDDVEYHYGPGVPIWGSSNYILSKDELRSGHIQNVTRNINCLIRTVKYPRDTEPTTHEKPSYEVTTTDFNADFVQSFNY